MSSTLGLALIVAGIAMLYFVFSARSGPAPDSFAPGTFGPGKGSSPTVPGIPGVRGPGNQFRP